MPKEWQPKVSSGCHMCTHTHTQTCAQTHKHKLLLSFSEVCQWLTVWVRSPIILSLSIPFVQCIVPNRTQEKRTSTENHCHCSFTKKWKFSCWFENSPKPICSSVIEMWKDSYTWVIPFSTDLSRVQGSRPITPATHSQLESILPCKHWEQQKKPSFQTTQL